MHSFDEQSAEHWAARFDDPKRDAWQKPVQVVEALRLEPGMAVADIGAGTGYFLPYLSGAVGPEGEVYGLDVAANMVRYMLQRAAKENWSNVRAGLVLTDDPLLRDASLDRILIVDTWHHIDSRERYAELLARALRPGGSIWVVDFKADSPEGPPAKHRLAPDAVAAELEAAGLETRVDETLLPYQYIVVAERL